MSGQPNCHEPVAARVTNVRIGSSGCLCGHLPNGTGPKIPTSYGIFLDPTLALD
jgi:hypothetical protein